MVKYVPMVKVSCNTLRICINDFPAAYLVSHGSKACLSIKHTTQPTGTQQSQSSTINLQALAYTVFGFGIPSFLGNQILRQTWSIHIHLIDLNFLFFGNIIIDNFILIIKYVCNKTLQNFIL